MRAPNGEEHDVSGVYREVIQSEKLIFTLAWKSTLERKSLVTLTFKDDCGGAFMTPTHEQFFDGQARESHQDGCNGAMEKLEKYLSA